MEPSALYPPRAGLRTRSRGQLIAIFNLRTIAIPIAIIVVPVQVAQHLANTYGDRAYSVAKMCKVTGKRWPMAGDRLHQEFPYLDAEVRYACCRELAATAVDVVARRTRLAFLNTYAAQEALPMASDACPCILC